MKRRSLYDPDLKQHSRELRTKMTDSERFLWAHIRRKQLNGCQFYTQKVIGDYIVDFFCPKAGLVIEVDGGQHLEAAAAEADRKRDEYLKSQGLKVLRYNNVEVLTNIDGVVEDIMENMKR